MGFRKGESRPQIINNFIFPDDLVGTVGNTATDPFAARRDPTGKIYSNFHFEWNLEEGANYGSDEFSTDFGKPVPVITLDFSESKWNYRNSKIISVTINNSARLIGGGGAGGHGVRIHATSSKSGDVSVQEFGGGGGGAGAGTGRNTQKAPSTSLLGWNGVGAQGDGWPHGELPQIHIKKKATSGTIGSRWDVAGSGGAKAEVQSSENISTARNIAHTMAYGHGSDGGTVFEVIHPATVQPIIAIKNSNTGIIVAGGGGGAGGYEVDGGSGGTSGEYGQSTYGRGTFYGGNPGSIIASQGGTYTRLVHITNANTGIVRGWNSAVSADNKSNTSTGITTGWSMGGDSNTYYVPS